MVRIKIAGNEELSTPFGASVLLDDIVSFVEAFSQKTTHKVKVLLQLPTDDPAFSVFATKFGRDFFFSQHQNSFPPL